MSIFDFSDERKKEYWSKRNSLLKDLRESINDAHMEYKELSDFCVSPESKAVIRFFIEYVINKGGVTPRDETIAGIMGLLRPSSRELSDENYYKKIDEGRKILSVLRKYEAVGQNLYFMSLSGARINLSWNQIVIDGIDHFSI